MRIATPSFKIQDMENNRNSRKNDRLDGKLRWELLPLTTLEEIVRIYTFGAEKYGPNTWQNLENGYERYKAALLRHLVSYEKGETTDAESGVHALAHMAWNAIAMLHLALEKEQDKNGACPETGQCTI